MVHHLVVATDLYSLAVLIFEMILGRVPFGGEDAHAVLYKVINQEMNTIEEDIPESVKSFLLKAINKDPLQRIGTCAEFENELNFLREDINKPDNSTPLDQQQIKQLQLFEDSSPEVLRELSSCLVFENLNTGEILISEQILDEYICLIQGKALLVVADKHIIVSEGEWLTDKTLPKELGAYSCKALSNSIVLRVSKSNILESSQATQAYFFRFILDRIFISQ